MTADIQFVYLRRDGTNYRTNLHMIDMMFIGKSGDVIWWLQDGKIVAFEFVYMLHIPEPQWIECSNNEAGYKSGLYDNGLPTYAPRYERLDGER